MLLKLFLAFTIVPVLEIYLLIKVGTLIGALQTVMIVIATGFIGASLARAQGLQTMMKVRESLNRGELPAEGLMDAFLIFFAGILLLTPGFITDVAGLFMLYPPTRFLFKKWLRKRFDAWVRRHQMDVHFRP